MNYLTHAGAHKTRGALACMLFSAILCACGEAPVSAEAEQAQAAESALSIYKPAKPVFRIEYADLVLDGSMALYQENDGAHQARIFFTNRGNSPTYSSWGYATIDGTYYSGYVHRDGTNPGNSGMLLNPGERGYLLVYVPVGRLWTCGWYYVAIDQGRNLQHGPDSVFTNDSAWVSTQCW